jgi:hypothetical protein
MKKCLAVLLGALLLALGPANASPPIYSGSDSALEILDATSIFKGNVHDIDQRRKSWDQQQLLAALQGIVNRDRPRLFVLAVGREGRTDRFWLEKMRRPGEWLSKSELRQRTSLDALIADFRSMIKGLVVWDERVPATALIASTAAGVDDLLPARYDPRPDSLYTFLTTAPQGPKLPIRTRLINEDGTAMFTGARTGSAKCDATLWAIEHFLMTGKCDPHYLAYYPDGYWLKEPGNVAADHTLLLNHDFFISYRAFFFDLDPWNDEAPNDDPQQKVGTDSKVMLTMLRAAHDRAGGKPIYLGGFVPWNLKYTKTTGGKHENVPTEWRFTDVVSCFDGYIDADAPGPDVMPNASAFCHFPLAERYPQKHVSPTDLQQKGFLDSRGNVKAGNYAMIYIGDYDSAAWFYQRMPDLWEDPNRGKIPLGWAFDPSIERRFPCGLAYVRATATPNDSFIAGDSGYGYLNPGDLVLPRRWSGLPSGLAGWQELCQDGYRRWDLRVTGFVINGSSTGMNPVVKAAYAQFSPGGVVTQGGPAISMINGAPFLAMGPDLASPTKGIAQISQYFSQAQTARPRFGVFRTVLWSPTQQLQMVKALADQRPDIHIVSPEVLIGLAKLSRE